MKTTATEMNRFLSSLIYMLDFHRMAHKDHHYQRLHETLRSHSYKDVLKALTEIRTLLQDNKSHVKVATRLRATGITKILIKIIHKKYSKLLCLAMSVLSTCALELETRILVNCLE
jgi:hypothetical protein